MAFNSGKSSISLEDILSKTSEVEILYYYLGVVTIPTVIQSPLRKDRRPSMGLYSPDGKKIFYKDFSTNDRGNLFTLLGKLWGLSYANVLQKVHDDVIKFKSSTKIIKQLPHNIKSVSHINENTDLQCKVREWRNYDLEYWNTYGISIKWLEFAEIYPISHKIIIKEGKKYVFAADKYAYAYVERKDKKVTLKIYQPFNKEGFKWSNKNDGSVWDLWNKLPKKGDKLIITSSKKDALCIWANTGIPACSLQAESCMPKSKVVDELKQRFNKIYVLYDNDYKSEENHGRLLGKRLADTFDLIQIEIPEEYESKDSSDLYKNKGKQCLQQVIKSLVNDNTTK